MNKYRLLFLILMGFVFQSRAQGIHFEQDTTLAAVKAKARAANKPIFIDYYITWCTPCKWMVRNVFPNDTVGRFFNENFISMKMNADHGDGKKQAANYKVNVYPTYLFLDTAGNEIHRFTGAHKTKDFMAHAKMATDPQSGFIYLHNRYVKGERDLAFLRSYILAAWYAFEPNVVEMANWYFAFLPEAELVTKENFELMEKTILEMQQPAYQKLLKHHKAFGAVAGKQRVNAKINKLMSTGFDQYYLLNTKTHLVEVDEPRYTEAINKLKALDYEGKEELLAVQNLNYHRVLQHWPAYVAAAKVCIPQYLWNDVYALNSHAWNFYRLADKKEELEMALNWSKRSLELNDEADFLNTCAAICQKLKRKTEALEYAQKAYDRGKAEGEMLKEYEERLEAIKKM